MDIGLRRAIDEYLAEGAPAPETGGPEDDVEVEEPGPED